MCGKEPLQREAWWSSFYRKLKDYDFIHRWRTICCNLEHRSFSLCFRVLGPWKESISVGMAGIHSSSVLLLVNDTFHQCWLLLIGAEERVTKAVGGGSASPFPDPAWCNSHMCDLKEKRNSTGWLWLAFPRLFIKCRVYEEFLYGKGKLFGGILKLSFEQWCNIWLCFWTLLFFQERWIFASPKHLGALGTEQLCCCAQVCALQGFLLSSSQDSLWDDGCIGFCIGFWLAIWGMFLCSCRVPSTAVSIQGHVIPMCAAAGKCKGKRSKK